MATTTGLMTVEQYSELPENEPFCYELHFGKLVPIPRPKLWHLLIRGRLRDQLDAALSGYGIVMTGLPFRALPEYEVRAADIAYATRERWEQTKGEDYFFGAPDLIVEVLSPSNNAAKLDEKRALYLANGCRQFWAVDSRLREITVSTPDGLTRTYRSGESIPLIFAENQALLVDSVFADE